MSSKTLVNAGPGKFIVTFNDIGYAQDLSPENSIRMEKMVGRWEVESIDLDMTKVTYSFFCDPGGNLLPSLVNMHIQDTHFKTLKGLRQMVLKTKCVNSKIFQ